MAKTKFTALKAHKPIYYAKKDILGRSLAKAKQSKGNKATIKAFGDVAKRKAKKLSGWKAIKSKIKYK